MTTANDIGPLDWRIGIADKNGRPTPEFQRRWNSQRGNNSLIGIVGTGSGAPTALPVPVDGDVYIDTSTTPWTLYGASGGVWEKVGVYTFTDLSDTPSSYSGAGGEVVRVKSSHDGVEFATVSTVLDELGASQGDVLFRGASGWTVLTPGTSGNVLTTHGVSADPVWAAGGGGSGSVSPFYVTAPTAPTTTPFTLITQSGVTAAMVNTTRGVHFSVLGAGATSTNAILDQAIPSSTYTLTAWIVPTAAMGRFTSFGTYIRDSSTGKIAAYTIGATVANAPPGYRRLYWTTIGSFSSDHNLGVDMGANSPIWVQMIVGSTNVTFSISTDGEFFEVIDVISKTDFTATPDHCGIWFGPDQTDGPQNVTEHIHIMSYSCI